MQRCPRLSWLDVPGQWLALPKHLISGNLPSVCLTPNIEACKSSDFRYDPPTVYTTTRKVPIGMDTYT